MRTLFIDSCHPFLYEELSRNHFQCNLLYNLSEEEIENKIGDYEGVVIRSKIKLTKKILDKAKKLKFIARVGAGMENIDVAYAESKNIKCFHAPEGNRDAVGEHALGMLLNLFRNISRADKEIRGSKWIREENRGIEIGGKTIGIIGYGNTGSAFAKKLKGFDCTILAYDKYNPPKADAINFVKKVSLEEIFNETDILSLHLPFTEETTYLVNNTFINKFKKYIYIINTSRGKILNTGDLVKNLKSRKISGACLDVLEYENTSFEHLDTTKLPEAFQYLIQSDKVILSPHIAGWTFESNEKMARVLAEKILSNFS